MRCNISIRHWSRRILGPLMVLFAVGSCQPQPTDSTEDSPIAPGQAQPVLPIDATATSIDAPVVEVTASFGSFAVAVDPSSATLAIAETVQLTATVLDANGHPTGDVVTWATSNPSVASVDANGLVTANVEGSAEIVATFNGVGGSALVTVGGAGSPSGAFAYVANLNASSVSVIETAGNTVVATIPVGTTWRGHHALGIGGE